MNDDTEDCVHTWGEAELCETRLGNISSPVCRHCGAVKLLEEQRIFAAASALVKSVFEKPALAVGTEPSPELPITSNAPPAGVAVHDFQLEMFTDV
jgi:hypothetical protein